MPKKVDIRPGVSVLSVLRHLNYQPWFAFGEFVDNSVQSFIDHREELLFAHGSDFRLRVDIEIDNTSPARITIKDNAAGIYESEYERAFRPAALPPDRSGLAEFGMGMKSAACWFSPRWSVRTSALGESLSRTITFDIENIVNDNISELLIAENEESPDNHYTEIILDDIFRTPVGSTISKIKNHLTDIYRCYTRNDTLELYFKGDSLIYQMPKILEAPYYKDKTGGLKKWYKEINFDFGDGLSVNGFAALRDPASTTEAGFSLFRRDRLIQGSGDEKYRPEYIFGHSNSFTYQRLFGELHLQGFEVTHTKDGFCWDENEQLFLESLKEHLNSEELPILRQAENHRSRTAIPKLKPMAEEAVTNTVESMKEYLPGVLPQVASFPTVDTPVSPTPTMSIIFQKQFDIVFRNEEWSIVVQACNDPAESQWLALSERPEKRGDPKIIVIRVSTAHPFIMRFAQRDTEELEAFFRVAAALALAEILANYSGVRKAGTVRRNFNDILRDAMSEP